MAKSMQDQGHQIIAVVTLSNSVSHDDRTYGFPVVRLLRHRSRIIRFFHTVFTICKLGQQADVVYLNGLVFEGIVATKLFIRRPAVVKVVGDLIWERARNQSASNLELDSFQSSRLPFRWKFLRWLQAWYTSAATAVITPSEYLARIVVGWGVEKSRVRVVYNAVPQVNALHSETLSYDLVTVCRLVPWKGLQDLVSITAEQGLKLRVVGDGPMRHELESMARSLQANVSFAGHVNHGDVALEIRSAKLFVLNSTYEGLPHIVLEAKAAGVAVLASAAGGTPETIEHGVDGWLVPVGDKSKLSDSIRLLLQEDRLRDDLVLAGLKRMSAKFSLTTQVSETAAVLAEVCE
jgi:glycosyltransferase involved in cell wall biosynthesis